ncbi:MAG TPA: hypothetical protein VFW40_01295, partial [Capsulimonadaceae bacterium]|nr:hypothetical protein [Capsulimonadaceae bacterium]
RPARRRRRRVGHYERRSLIALSWHSVKAMKIETKRSKLAASRGFTFMEMMVIILVVLLISALVLPKVVAFTRSRAQKDLEGSIARLPSEARADSVKNQMPVSISIQDNQLVEQKLPQAVVQTQANGGQPQQNTNTQPQVIKQIDLGNDIQVASVEKNGQPADIGTWNWTVYPDGTADDAGVEFSEGSVTKSLILPAYGDSQWVSGNLPGQTPTQWPAGQLQSNTQTTLGTPAATP